MTRLLVLAGLDPTGGAGVDADREAAAALGVSVDAVVTADTDQDGRSVRSVAARDPGLWLAEARAVLARGETGAAKSGLLPHAGAVRAVAELAEELEVPLVVDPVLAASGGEPFLDEAGITVLLEELLPRRPFLTPNLVEAARLTGTDPARLAESSAARLEVARELLERGARACLLKGGHGLEDPVHDLVLEAGVEPVWVTHARVRGGGLHGSGCRYASALAAGLAEGRSLVEAARLAGAYLVERIRAGARPAAPGSD